MEDTPPEKPVLTNVWLAIILAPFGIAFIVAASLSAGPREVFRALTGRK